MTEEELTQLLNATDEAIDKAIKIMQRVMKIQDHPVCSHKKIDKNADNNDEHSTQCLNLVHNLQRDCRWTYTETIENDDDDVI